MFLLQLNLMDQNLVKDFCISLVDAPKKNYRLFVAGSDGFIYTHLFELEACEQSENSQDDELLLVESLHVPVK